MSVDQYKGNSNKEKAERKQREKAGKVISGNAKVRKKTGATKFAENFVNEDVHNVKNYIVMDVLIPAAKKAISDIVSNGIDMLLYGETRPTSKKGSSAASYISYNKYSSRDERDYRSSRERSGFDYDELIFDTRGEAEELLNSMDDILDNYPTVSIADMYDLAGMSCPHTYNKYGWTSLRSAETVRVSGGGYVIKLPKARPLD